MTAKSSIKDLQHDVRWYQRKVDVTTFISDIRGICNNAGYYADDPRETKQFWSRFAQDCISNGDYELNDAFYNFFQQKYAQLKTTPDKKNINEGEGLCLKKCRKQLD